MTVIIWISEGTWQATVDAARAHAPAAADLVLLHVTSDDVTEMVRGSFAGLLGRDRRGRDAVSQVEAISRVAAAALLDDAARAAGTPGGPARAPRPGRTRGRPRRRRGRPADLRPRRRPRSPRAAQPGAGHPVRHRPRALPGAAGVARAAARGRLAAAPAAGPAPAPSAASVTARDSYSSPRVSALSRSG